VTSLTRLFATIDRATDGSAAKAPCLRQDPGLWFSEERRDVQRAKDLCWECPVRQACFDGATERRETGVWGGHLLDRGQVTKRGALRGPTF
jgi:WhiB family redox-sensing transcriptional regulator